MTMKSTSYAAALVAGLLLPAVALPVSAFAQNETPGGVVALTHKAKATAATPVDRVEQHITRLHARLHITPAQQADWDQFAQVMRDNAKDMNQTLEQRNAGFGSMTAVDNMQSYAQLAQQHAQDTQKLAAAFQTLYGSFSDDQKKNADAVFRARGEHAPHTKG
jgi:hypothetical protein